MTVMMLIMIPSERSFSLELRKRHPTALSTIQSDLQATMYQTQILFVALQPSDISSLLKSAHCDCDVLDVSLNDTDYKKSGR